LVWLEHRGAVRPISAPPRPQGTRGQHPSPGFEVNPAILGSGSHISQNSLDSHGEPTPVTQESGSHISQNSSLCTPSGPLVAHNEFREICDVDSQVECPASLPEPGLGLVPVGQGSATSGGRICTWTR
jgi:hypothetical protein